MTCNTYPIQCQSSYLAPELRTLALPVQASAQQVSNKVNALLHSSAGKVGVTFKSQNAAGQEAAATPWSWPGRCSDNTLRL
eukprot:2146044-Amphidinium_carterae.1